MGEFWNKQGTINGVGAVNIDAVKLRLMGYSNIIQGYSTEKMLIFEKIEDRYLVGGMGIGYST